MPEGSSPKKAPNRNKSQRIIQQAKRTKTRAQKKKKKIPDKKKRKTQGRITFLEGSEVMVHPEINMTAIINNDSSDLEITCDLTYLWPCLLIRNSWYFDTGCVPPTISANTCDAFPSYTKFTYHTMTTLNGAHPSIILIVDADPLRFN